MSVEQNLAQAQLNKNRLDKFLLVFALPEAMRNINSNNLLVRSNKLVNSNSMQFSVFGSLVPKVTVPSIAAGYSGQNYKVSSHGRPPYDDITVKFTIDNRFNNWWVIYKWLDILNGEKESYYNPDNPTYVAGGYTKPPKPLQPQYYQTDFTVYGKDEFDENVIKFTYTKAFPTDLEPFDYNYRTPGEIESSFTFSFSQFYSELINPPAK